MIMEMNFSLILHVPAFRERVRRAMEPQRQCMPDRKLRLFSTEIFTSHAFVSGSGAYLLFIKIFDALASS